MQRELNKQHTQILCANYQEADWAMSPSTRYRLSGR